jgi:hypothetical protein
MDFSETVEIKVLDKEDNCVDSYFFAYFHNLDLAVDQIRQAVQKAKTQSKSSARDTVKDTTSHMLAAPSVPHPVPTDSLASPSTSTLAAVRDKLVSPVGKLNSLMRPATSPTPQSSSRPTSMISTDGSLFTASPGNMSPNNQSVADHTYPPSLVHHPTSQTSDTSGKSTWSVPVGVPNWLKNPSKRFFTSSPDIAPVHLSSHADVGDIHETAHQLSADHADFGFSIVDGIESNALDPSTVDKFRAAFAFDDKETLLAGKHLLLLRPVLI